MKERKKGTEVNEESFLCCLNLNSFTFDMIENKIENMQSCSATQFLCITNLLYFSDFTHTTMLILFCE
jgi:hypothetical protein